MAESALPSLEKLSQMWSRAWQCAHKQVGGAKDKGLPPTKVGADVMEQATDNFEACLGYYLNPGTFSGNELAPATVRRLQPGKLKRLRSSELLDQTQLLMPPSRLTREQAAYLMSIPLDPDMAVPSVIFGSEQLSSCR